MNKTAGRKQMWYIIVFAFSMMLILLTAMRNMFMPQAAGSGQTPILVEDLPIILMLLAAIPVRSIMPGQGMGASQFQTKTIMALAIAEFPSILSFALSMMYSSKALALQIPCGLVLILAIILPAGIRYWRQQ